MKNIIYLVISSIAIVGITGLVITLFHQDKEMINNVAGSKDIYKNISSDGMVEQGTYSGSDVVSFIKYYENSDIFITVNFSPTITEIDTTSRNVDIYGDDTATPRIRGVVDIMKEDTYSKLVEGVTIYYSYQDGTYEKVVTDSTHVRFNRVND